MFIIEKEKWYDSYILSQWAKSPKKQSVGVYSEITKNALLQTAFFGESMG